MNGFVHGLIYSAVAAGIAFGAMGFTSAAVGLWLAFIVLDLISCVTYSELVIKRRKA